MYPIFYFLSHDRCREALVTEDVIWNPVKTDIWSRHDLTCDALSLLGSFSTRLLSMLHLLLVCLHFSRDASLFVTFYYDFAIARHANIFRTERHKAKLERLSSHEYMHGV